MSTDGKKGAWIMYGGVFVLTLAVLVPSLLSQTARGSVSGIVLNQDGAPLNDAKVKVVGADKKLSQPASTAVSDGDGRFGFSGLANGRYSLSVSHKYFGPKVERSFAITAGESTNLTIELGRACATTSAGPAEAVTEKDKAQVVNLALRKAFDHRVVSSSDSEPVILSNQNIRLEWLEPTKSINFVVMSPTSIQRKADATGDFLYLSFSEIKVTGSCIAIEVGYSWAIGKKSKVLFYLSGAGIEFEFRKKNGEWVGEKVLEWVS